MSAEIPNRLRPKRKPRTVLDVGCGIQPQDIFPRAESVRLDAHRPYLEEITGIRVWAEWQEFIPKLLPGSFDAVVALDFLEHLPRRQGFRFLREAQRVAPYVVIFTPEGWLEQTHDGFDMGGEHWQTHRSAWTVADFDGWRTTVMHDYHGHGVNALWAATR